MTAEQEKKIHDLYKELCKSGLDLELYYKKCKEILK